MLTNATGAYGQSVSEHMFAMMWSIMKNLHIYAVGNPNAAWQDAGRVISPDGKTALIIGTGDIGSHFARLCKSVGMSTIGIRRNPTVEAPGIDRIVGFESLDDVLQYADVDRHVRAIHTIHTPPAQRGTHRKTQNRRHRHQRGPR